MARAVGLDIGSRTIKLVELSGSAKSFKIQRVALREVPRPPEAQVEGEPAFDPATATAQAVREMFDGLKLPKEDICASFDSGTTISREIVVPVLEADKIRKVVRFEAEHHLHSQSVDEVVVNWLKTGETKEGSRLTIFASSKEELVKRLAVMRMAGVEPASVDMDITAAFTCADALGLFQAHPNALLLDVGAHVTSLMLVVDGKPRTVRSFLLGVGALPQALPAGQRPGPDLFAAAGALEAQRGQAATAELEARTPQLEFVKKLHREVLRSLPTVRSDAPPTVAYVAGGGALHPELLEALQERFGVPVERMNVLDKVECRDPGPEPAATGALIVGAVGCALRVLGRNPLQVELLQDEFAPSNTFDVVRTAAATAVTLLFLVLLGLNLAENRKHQAALAANDRVYGAASGMFVNAEKEYLTQVEHKDAASALAEAQRYAGSLPRDERRLGLLRARLIDRYRRLQSDLGMAKEIPEVRSATRVYYELVKAISEVPRDELGDWFAITKFECNERRLTFTIETSEVKAFDTVYSLVSKSPFFKELAKGSIERQSRTQTPEKYESCGFELKFKEQE